MAFLCHAAYPVNGQSVTNDLKLIPSYDLHGLCVFCYYLSARIGLFRKSS